MAKCKHCHGTGYAPDWKRVGAELRRRRVLAAVSLRQVARDAGISAAGLSDIERGNRSAGGPKGRAVLKRFGLHPDHAYDRPMEAWKP